MEGWGAELTTPSRLNYTATGQGQGRHFLLGIRGAGMDEAGKASVLLEMGSEHISK